MKGVEEGHRAYEKTQLEIKILREIIYLYVSDSWGYARLAHRLKFRRKKTMELLRTLLLIIFM